MDFSEALEILRQTKTGTQFINMVMTNELYLMAFEEEENYKAINSILNSLDLSYDNMPKDALKLNVLLTICNKFETQANYLGNYKEAVVHGNLDLAFEYNKRGIFRQSSSEWYDNFEEKIIENNGENYFHKYTVLNSNFMRNIYKKDEKYPLMMASIREYGIIKKFSGSDFKNINVFSKLFEHNYIYCEKALSEFDKSDENISKKEDNLTYLLFYITNFQVNMNNFVKYIEQNKYTEYIMDDIEPIFDEDLAYLPSNVIENLKPVSFLKENKYKLKEKTFPQKLMEKTDKRFDGPYLKITFGSTHYHAKALRGMITNSPFLSELITDKNKFEIYTIEDIYSPYSFSWALFLLDTRNYNYFAENFDMGYLHQLISDLKILRAYDVTDEIVEKSIQIMKYSSNINISEDLNLSELYEGDKMIFLPE